MNDGKGAFSFTPPPSGAPEAGVRNVSASNGSSPGVGRHKTGAGLNQLFSPQGNKPLDLLKCVGTVSKEYDKESKSQVVAIEHTTAGSKISLVPPQGGGSGGDGANLLISHPIIAIQLLVQGAGTFSVELSIADTLGRKRLMFSSGFSSVLVDPLHTKLPLVSIPRLQWITLAFDVQEIYTQTFGYSSQLKCITGLTIAGVCKVRRIFSLQDWPGDPAFPTSIRFPSQIDFPLGVVAPAVPILRGTELGSAPKTAAKGSQKEGLGVKGTTPNQPAGKTRKGSLPTVARKTALSSASSPQTARGISGEVAPTTSRMPPRHSSAGSERNMTKPPSLIPPAAVSRPDSSASAPDTEGSGIGGTFMTSKKSAVMPRALSSTDLSVAGGGYVEEDGMQVTDLVSPDAGSTNSEGAAPLSTTSTQKQERRYNSANVFSSRTSNLPSAAFRRSGLGPQREALHPGTSTADMRAAGTPTSVLTVEELVPEMMRQSMERVVPTPKSATMGSHRGSRSSRPSSVVQSPASISTSISRGMGEVQSTLESPASNNVRQWNGGEVSEDPCIQTFSSDPPPARESKRGSMVVEEVVDESSPLVLQDRDAFATRPPVSSVVRSGEGGYTPSSLREVSTVTGGDTSSHKPSDDSAAQEVVDELGRHQPTTTGASRSLPVSERSTGGMMVPQRYVDASFSSVSSSHSSLMSGGAGNAFRTRSTQNWMGIEDHVPAGLTKSQQKFSTEATGEAVVTDADAVGAVQFAGSGSRKGFGGASVQDVRSSINSTSFEQELDPKYYRYNHRGQQEQPLTAFTYQQSTQQGPAQHRYQNATIEDDDMDGKEEVLDVVDANEEEHSSYGYYYQQGGNTGNNMGSPSFYTDDGYESFISRSVLSAASAAKQLTYGETTIKKHMGRNPPPAVPPSVTSIPLDPAPALRHHHQDAFATRGVGSLKPPQRRAGPEVERLSGTGIPITAVSETGAGGSSIGGEDTRKPSSAGASGGTLGNRFVFDPLLGCYYDVKDGKYISKGEHKNMMF